MAVVKITRRQFFSHLLLGAAVTVPVLLTGCALASKTSVSQQDHIRRGPKFLDESQLKWIDSHYIRFINIQNMKLTRMGHYTVRRRRPVYLRSVSDA